MVGNKVINFIGKLVDKPDSEITIKLERVIYSNRHKEEICVLQLIGKNSWPKMTTQEILSDPKAMKGLSVEDVITITRLDEEIKRRKSTYKVLEIDVNGTILLEDSFGRVRRYSEKYVSNNREILANLPSLDAHDIGYRVGFREGLSISSMKKKAKKFFNKTISFIKK